MGKIKQLVKQFDSAAQLKLCQEGLRRSLENFKVSDSFSHTYLFYFRAVTDKRR
jgi:hypothetical protein